MVSCLWLWWLCFLLLVFFWFPIMHMLRNKWYFVVQSLSRVQLLAVASTGTCQASLSFTVSLSLLRLMPIGSVMQSTISYSVTPFSCPQSFPASWSFPMSWLFTSGDQSIEALASVLPMNVQGWFPLDWLVWSPCYPRDSQKSLSSTTVWKHQFFGAQPSYGPTLTSKHDYWKNHCTPFVSKVMSPLFNMLSRFAIDFLPRSKCLLISWL